MRPRIANDTSASHTLDWQPANWSFLSSANQSRHATPATDITSLTEPQCPHQQPRAIERIKAIRVQRTEDRPHMPELTPHLVELAHTAYGVIA
eukprot:15476909-Alexandrium_andersonii.AAC.1